MFDSLIAAYYNMVAATSGNPILAPLITLSLIGGIGWLAKSLPLKLWQTLKNQTTTSITLHNAGHWGNRLIFLGFLSWYTDLPSSKWSRKYSIEAKDGIEDLTVGPGYGLHIIWFQRRLFWFYKSALESGGAENQKEQLEIFTFGRSRKPIDSLIQHFKPKPKAPGTTEIYSLQSHGWTRAAIINDRPLESVIVEAATLQKLLKSIDEFYEKRSWYVDRGMAHKLCILLHGVTGGGKTSLIKALAGRYGANIYKLNINQLTDNSLESALAGVPKGNMVLIEDFDSSEAVHKRIESLEPVMPFDPNAHVFIKDEKRKIEYDALSLTGVLNAFDGVIPLDNTIVFFTTNHREKIDGAMLRRGRIDVEAELGPLNDAEIKQYVNYVYGQHDLSSYSFQPTAGCHIYGLLIEYKNDYDGFKAALIEKYNIRGELGTLGHDHQNRIPSANVKETYR